MNAPEKPWYVYMLECSDGTLYTGITICLEKRIGAHNQGKGSRYVKSRLPASLLAYTQAESRSAASKQEYLIKQLPRTKKLALAMSW